MMDLPDIRTYRWLAVRFNAILIFPLSVAHSKHPVPFPPSSRYINMNFSARA